MSCPDFEMSQRGREGIGVNQPQSGLDYPLVASGDTDPAIRNLIADFYFEYDDDAARPATHPLRIKYLYNVGCVDNALPAGGPLPLNDADIVLVGDDGLVVFDTTTDSATVELSNWGNDYTIYTWKTPNAVCRLVAHTTWPDNDDEKKQYNKHIAPTNAVLDERAVYRMPRRLRTIKVRNANVTSPAFDGRVKLVNGYNTEITAAAATTQDFRLDTQITVAGAPGSGRGAYANCDDVDAAKSILKINGLSPTTTGDFLLSAASCLWSRRPTTYSAGVVTPSTTAQQQIGADCVPCCSCEEYVSTAKYMNNTALRYSLIGNRSENIRTLHEDNIARWLDQRACSVLRPLRLLLVPQRCPYIDVVLMVCNPCDTCLGASTLNVEFSIAVAGVTATLECGYTAMFAPGINGSPVGIGAAPGGLGYSASFPQIAPGESAYVQFRLKFLESDTTQNPPYRRPRGPYPITGILTGTMNSGGTPLMNNCGNEAAVPASAEATQTLYCNAAGNTEAPC